MAEKKTYKEEVYGGEEGYHGRSITAEVNKREIRDGVQTQYIIERF